MPRPTLGGRSPIRWGYKKDSYPREAKQLEREAHHSPPPSAKIKNAWSFISISSTFLHGIELRHKHDFTFSILALHIKEFFYHLSLFKVVILSY
jgi:hypothetical protein